MTFRAELKRSWDGKGCDDGVEAAGDGGRGATAGAGHGAGGGAGKGEGRGAGGGGGPGTGRGGYGWKNLTELCSEEGIVLAEALAALASHGVTADGGMTVRQVEDLLGVRPSEVAASLGARPSKSK